MHDSLSFELAAGIAFKQAAKKASPVLMEPIMSVEVTTPDEFTGDVTGDLTGTASQVAIANGADNRVLTAASANTINGEANLTFDGSTLSIGGNLTLASGKATIDSIEIDGSTISNVNASPNQAIFLKPSKIKKIDM